MVEISYNLTGYVRLVKKYDWYEVHEKDFWTSAWSKVYRGYNRDKALEYFHGKA